MNNVHLRNLRTLVRVSVLLGLALLSDVVAASGAEVTNASAYIRVDPGHLWRPPFGLDRVDRPFAAIVEISAAPSSTQKYSLAAFLDGQQIQVNALVITNNFPSTNRITFATWPTELVLTATDAEGKTVTLARETIQPAGFEADAIAQPDVVINPVDLGTILVPHDWLLLASGQEATVRVAAICRTNNLPGVRFTAWFESLEKKKTSSTADLAKNKRWDGTLHLPPNPARSERDVLSVSLEDLTGGRLWLKKIPVVLIRNPPHWPAFGATATRLRYDAPISLLNRETGVLSSMSYSNGWAPELHDVVISLPNGSRFVFWRGSSYVPFWAGAHNTGMTYEWAERPPPPEGFSDSVEPLMDKELRYGRVEIVESTSARVHVRWRYQSCDFNYKVFGDAAVEDFYFYPDGFGTRALSLRSAPNIKWELSEFIILTPQSAYPFEILPSNLIDALPLDGKEKQQLSFPFQRTKKPLDVEKVERVPLVYRVRLHKDELATAIYFNPNDSFRPQELGIFGPFFDKRYLVTPAYWGSHWPLGRGKTTGATIDNRIYSSPAHNSLMSWVFSQPAPISTTTSEMMDALGQTRLMTLRRWAWLIAMTDTTDARLLDWARSFANPPSLKVEGGRLDIDSFVPQRRAIRIIVEQKNVSVSITPSVRCVNPVFELLRAPKKLTRIQLADRTLQPKEYAWDGQTLWLNTDLDVRTRLQLEFSTPPH